MEFRELLIALVVIWLAAKLAAEGMQRIGQTATLGELLAGVVIGAASAFLFTPPPRYRSRTATGSTSGSFQALSNSAFVGA